MANIAEYVESLKIAQTGVEMRKPIAEALRAINEQGQDTDAITGYSEDGSARTFVAEDFLLRTQLGKAIPANIYPTKNSMKMVTSGGTYSLIGNLGNIDWGGTNG